MDTAQALTFGTLLKRHRRAAGLTQEELAERAELSVEAISALERGVSRAPHRDTVGLLAEALGISPTDRPLFEAAARRREHVIGPVSAPGAFSRTGPDGAPIVGRAHELELLDRHLAGKGPPVLLFAGEPGIGKSRLLREAAARARLSGWCVLSGATLRRSMQDPYAPLLDALQSRLRPQTPAQLREDLRQCARLVRLLPELADAGVLPSPPSTLMPEQERRLAFGAVSRFLSNIAGPAGTLLVLDGLQWAGADALDLMTSLLQTPSDAPLRVVGAYRDTEVSPRGPFAAALAELARAGLAVKTRLGPLGPVESAELLGYLIEEARLAEAGVVDRIVARAGGVPFFLVSCAQGLLDGSVIGTPDDVPWDVAETIRQRLAALPDAAGEVVDVVAVADHRVAGTALARAASQPGWEPDAFQLALDTLCRARVLVEVPGDRYQFAYSLIREVVWSDLGAARRGILHRRIADALEREPGQSTPEVLAYHLARSGQHEKAVVFLERAADAAQAIYANAAAENLYRELVAELNELGWIAQRARALEKLGGVLRIQGQYDEALGILERSAQDYRLAGDIEGLRQAIAAVGRVHARRGMPDAGIARILPLVKDAGAIEPTAGMGALHVALAELYFAGGRHQEQLAAADQAIQIARMLTDDRLLTQAEQWRSTALLTLGRSVEAVPALEEIIPVAEALGDLSSHLHALNHVALAYIRRGEFDTSGAYIDRALAAASTRGDPLQTAMMTYSRGVFGLYTGNWRRAREDFEAAATALRRLPIASGLEYPLASLAQLSVLEGRWDAALAYLKEATPLAERSGDAHALRRAYIAAAERDLLQGRPEAARTRLEGLLVSRGRDEGEGFVHLLAAMAWTCLDLGDVAKADEWLAEGMTHSLADQDRPALTEVLRIRGVLAAKRQSWEEADSSLAEALSLCLAMHYPYGEARVHHAFAALEAARGNIAAAHEHLRTAAALLSGLGERLFAVRVAAALANT